MLCPNCGVDVGDFIRLCDRCEELARTPPPEEQPSDQETLDAAIDSEPVEVLEVEDRPKNRVWLWLLLFVSLTVIVIGVAYIILDRKPPNQTAKLPLIAPEDLPLAQQAPVPRMLKDGGSATIQGRDFSFKSTLALWDPESRQLEIRFFEAEADRRNDANYSVALALTPRQFEEALDRQDVAACQLHFFVRRNQHDVPCEFDQGDGEGSIPQFKFLSGNLGVGGEIFGELMGAVQLGQGDDLLPLEFRWNLAFNTSVVDRKSYEAAHFLFDDRGLTEALALFDSEKHEITLGYFKQAVTATERALMQTEKRLDVSPANLPVVVAHFTLTDQAAAFTAENIDHYKVAILNDAQEIYAFEGERSGLKDAALSGLLQEKSVITGLFREKLQSIINGLDKEIHIFLPFNATVLDLNAKSIAFATSNPTIVNDSIGYLRAGVEEVKFKVALGHYYSQVNRIEIGFYGTDLSADEMQQITNNRSFIAPVNGKRANMILSILFASDARSASLDQILEANIYFIRDPVGGFYFPGSADRRSLARSRDAFRRGELERFSGELRVDGLVNGILRGEELIPAVGSKFTWRVEFGVKLNSVSSSR